MRLGQVVVFAGAGLSTAAGIPDFRSPGGVWERFDPGEFDIAKFHANPAAFWQRRAALIAAMDYLHVEPTSAHHRLAELARRGIVRIVTQNVDGLHALADTPADALIELHGNGRRTICLTCGAREDVQTTLAGRIDGQAPTCSCGGVMKPDVVLFGEAVTAMPDAASWVRSADHLLVLGTSLQVHPAAGLVDLALASDVPVTILNRDPTPYDDHATVVRGAIEEHLGDALRLAGAAQ